MGKRRLLKGRLFGMARIGGGLTDENRLFHQTDGTTDEEV